MYSSSFAATGRHFVRKILILCWLMGKMDVLSLILQLAPAVEVINRIHDIPEWPSLQAQDSLCCMLSLQHLQSFPPPVKGWKYLFKCIEKDIHKLYYERGFVNGSDEMFSDAFMELLVESQTASPDADNSGYLSFKSILLPSIYIPIKVIQSHNQVGTKVWGAGVFLGELLQYKPDLLARQKVLELGAGVGITGLLLGRALPEELQPAKIIMTDFHHEVVDLLAHNIIVSNMEGRGSGCVIEADVLDWSTVASSDYIRYDSKIMLVADCTYSEFGNVHLVRSMKLFFRTMSVTGQNTPSVHFKSSDTDDNEAYMQSLIENGIPFVLIACTVRSAETYGHFHDLVHNDSELQVVDMSHWAMQCFPVSPVYFYVEDRTRIKLLCIHLRASM